MICPQCQKNNRPAAKVCAYCGKPLPLSSAQRFPWTPIVFGGILFLMGCVSSLGIGWLLWHGSSSPSTPTTGAISIVSPTPSPTIVSAATSTHTPGVTPTHSPTSGLTRVPSPTVPVIAGDKRLDPTTDRRGVVVTDLSNNTGYPLFTVPSAGEGLVLSAAWSPDGKKILLSFQWWTSDFDYGHIVRIVDEQGRNPRDIIQTTVSKEGVNAAHAYRDAIWSVDGKKIAVRYQYGSDFGIWLFNADGTGKQRLASSAIGDWPRFWSEDGHWVIGVSSQDNRLYAEAIDQNKRVPFEAIKGIRMFDQRYFPWRITQDMICNVSGEWYYRGGAYWDCH
jgi:hypothetical protein